MNLRAAGVEEVVAARRGSWGVDKTRLEFAEGEGDGEEVTEGSEATTAGEDEAGEDRICGLSLWQRR